MSTRSLITVIWILSIVHGIQYIVTTPLWEGFDEPFHYAYIQNLAEFGRIPVHGETLVSKEITSSFRAMPLSPSVNSNLGNRYTDFPAYFKLPEPERKERGSALRNIPHTERRVPDRSDAACLSYEAQHPPLYYALSALVYRAFQSCDLPTLVLVLRVFSLLIGSLTIILSYKIAKLFYSDKCRILFFPLCIALLPMFFSTVARISNDSLGVTLFSLLVFLVLNFTVSGNQRANARYIGIVLGLGLLTKAYFLTALPVIAVVYILSGIRQKALWPATRCLLWTFSFAFLVAGAWYVRNYNLYGTVSGLFVMASAEPVPLAVHLGKILEVPWPSSLDIVFREFLWVGNSTFIGISKTYYHLGYFVLCLAAFGIAGFFFPKAFPFFPLFGRNRLREKNEVSRMALFEADKSSYRTLLFFCFFFILGMMYQIHQTFVITGDIATGGWYLYATVIPISLLLYIGIEHLMGVKGNRLIPSILLFSVFALGFLGNFCKAIPYYTGFNIPHFNLQHLLEVYSPDGFSRVAEQLSINLPVFITPLVIGIIITLYFAMVFIALRLWWKIPGTKPINQEDGL